MRRSSTLTRLILKGGILNSKLPTQPFAIKELGLFFMSISAAWLKDMYSKMTCLTKLTLSNCDQEGNEHPHLVPASGKLRYDIQTYLTSKLCVQ